MNARDGTKIRKVGDGREREFKGLDELVPDATIRTASKTADINNPQIGDIFKKDNTRYEIWDIIEQWQKDVTGGWIKEAAPAYSKDDYEMMPDENVLALAKEIGYMVNSPEEARYLLQQVDPAIVQQFQALSAGYKRLMTKKTAAMSADEFADWYEKAVSSPEAEQIEKIFEREGIGVELDTDQSYRELSPEAKDEVENIVRRWEPGSGSGGIQMRGPFFSSKKVKKKTADRYEDIEKILLDRGIRVEVSDAAEGAIFVGFENENERAQGRDILTQLGYIVADEDDYLGTPFFTVAGKKKADLMDITGVPQNMEFFHQWKDEEGGGTKQDFAAFLRRQGYTGAAARVEDVSDEQFATLMERSGAKKHAQNNYVACAKMMEQCDKLSEGAMELQQMGSQSMGPIIETAEKMKEHLLAAMGEMHMMDAPGTGEVAMGEPIMEPTMGQQLASFDFVNEIVTDGMVKKAGVDYSQIQAMFKWDDWKEEWRSKSGAEVRATAKDPYTGETVEGFIPYLDSEHNIPFEGEDGRSTGYGPSDFVSVG